MCRTGRRTGPPNFGRRRQGRGSRPREGPGVPPLEAAPVVRERQVHRLPPLTSAMKAAPAPAWRRIGRLDTPARESSPCRSTATGQDATRKISSKSQLQSRLICGSCQSPVAIPKPGAKPIYGTLVPPRAAQKQGPASHFVGKNRLFGRSGRVCLIGRQRIRRPRTRPGFDRKEGLWRDAGSLHQ